MHHQFFKSVLFLSLFFAIPPVGLAPVSLAPVSWANDADEDPPGATEEFFGAVGKTLVTAPLAIVAGAGHIIEGLGTPLAYIGTIGTCTENEDSQCEADDTSLALVPLKMIGAVGDGVKTVGGWLQFPMDRYALDIVERPNPSDPENLSLTKSMLAPVTHTIGGIGYVAEGVTAPVTVVAACLTGGGLALIDNRMLGNPLDLPVATVAVSSAIAGSVLLWPYVTSASLHNIALEQWHPPTVTGNEPDYMYELFKVCQLADHSTPTNMDLAVIGHNYRTIPIEEKGIKQNQLPARTTETTSTADGVVE